MAGSTKGAKLAVQKNLAKDPDYYKKLGAIGGRASGSGGFAADNDRARTAGALGGKYGRKGHRLIERTETSGTYQRKSDGVIVEIKY